MTVQGLMDVIAGLLPILVVLGLFIAVLWVLLPFAVFGVKARLDEQTALLREIRDRIDKPAEPTPHRPPDPDRDIPARSEPRF